MVDPRKGGVRPRVTLATRAALAPWPSALDIPQRITDWPAASGYLDQEANDNIAIRVSDTFYSIGDVQEMWGVSATTLYREIRAGKLMASKVGGQWRITESALVTYLKANEHPLCLPGHPLRRRQSS